MVNDDSLTPRIMAAEQAVLGSMLIDESLVGPVIAEVDDSDFTFSIYRTIFQAMKSLFRAGEVVDPVTVCGRLGSDDAIRKTVLELMEITPTTANIWVYVPLMKEQARLVQLKELGERLHDAQDLDEARELLGEMNARVVMRSKSNVLWANDILALFAERHSGGNRPEYISLGIDGLDDNVRIEAGNYVIIGGTPSSGKTALALQFAWHISKTKRVGFYSLETSYGLLSDRSVAGLGGISMGDIKRSNLTDSQWDRFSGLGKVGDSCQIGFVQASGFSVDDIAANAAANRFDVIFVDYVQLIRTKGRAFGRVEAVTDISISLHELAQKRGIAVIGLSQLSRETVKDSEPSMHHLRESGQLEQDADVIMLLYRKPTPAAPDLRGLKIAKNKDGPIGKIFLDFDGPHQTFAKSNINPDHRGVAAQLRNEGKKAKIMARLDPQPKFEQLNISDEEVPF